MRKLAVGVVALGFLCGSPAFSRADETGEARAILDKAIEAHGGAEKLGQHKAMTVKMKGKTSVMGMDFEYTGSFIAQLPNQSNLTTEVEVMGNKVTFQQVFNKDQGWIKLNDKVMNLDKEALATARKQLHQQWTATLVPLRDKAFTLAPAGEIKIGDRMAVGIRVSHKDAPDFNLYFDKKTGLLTKSEYRAQDPLAGNEEATYEVFYTDYKPVGGIQRATKMTMTRDGKSLGDHEETEYQGHDKLDDSVFAKP